MRKYIKNISLILITVCLLACSDNFLEEKVDNRTLIETIDELEYTLVGLTPRASHLFTELMTDDYSFKEISGYVSAGIRDKLMPLFEFQVLKESLSNTSFLSNGFNPYLAWRRYYFRIENSLLVIQKAKKIQVKNEDERNRINTITGQATAIKAYCNFMLVNLFAKHYNPATAPNDKGIPYVREYTGKAFTIHKTESIEQIYKNIEKDLLSALSLINDEYLPNKKFHFTTLSVQALLCRFYLFKKDYENCIKYANLVTNEISNLLPVRKLMIENNNQGNEYSKQYFHPDRKSYLLMSAKTYQLIAYHHGGFYPYPIQSYMQNNGQKWLWNVFLLTSPIYNDIVPTKYLYFDGADNGNQIHLPLITVDEVVYNRAEALIMEGQIAEAKKDLEALISEDNYDNKANEIANLNQLTDQQDLTTFLLRCKRMRFFCEGIRWFDIKRHEISVSHTTSSGTYTIGKPEDYVIQPPLEELDF